MLTAFEATILGYVWKKSSTRYEIMKIIQEQSLLWAGGTSAVYSAVARLAQKKYVEEVDSTGTAVFSLTQQGLLALRRFLEEPVLSSKLILDPALLRMKLRGQPYRSKGEQITFYRSQLELIDEACELVVERQSGTSGEKISKDLADLAIAQLRLEAELIEEYLTAAIAMED